MNSAVKFIKVPHVKWKINIDVKKFSRAITGDRLTPLNQETLTGRFLLYLDNNKLIKDTNCTAKINLINLLKTRSVDIETFETNCIVAVLNTLGNKEAVQNKHEFYTLLHLIDEECCKRVKKLDVDATIELLHSFMISIPHRITECHYFHLALDDLMNQRHKLNKNQLIQLIFFIGLLKKSNNAQHMLRQCLKLLNKEYVDNLTKEDLCIICNSTFKTSTKIKHKLFLEKVKLYISDNLCLLKDPAVFVTLIKTLRHNRYQDEDILSTITCTIFFNRTLQYYSFSAICHILALYADYLYHDEKILEIFTQKSLELLQRSIYQSKDAYLEMQPRLKDIKRLLWALSNLNYKLNTGDIERIVVPEILSRIKAGECSNDPGTVVDIILYLWMMQYKAYDLIKEVLTKRNLLDLVRANNFTNQRNLNLLLTCIHYEDTELFNSLKMQPVNINPYNQTIQLHKRPALQRIIDNLDRVTVDHGIDKFDINCQVPFINIIGITGFQKKIYRTVNIEVLDDYTCLKNTDSLPTGLMQLKLRLLEKCDAGLVVIENKDITDFSDMELQGVLQEEISLVC